MPPTKLPLALKVSGMTCAHCVEAVRQAIAERDPTAVTELDLASGQLHTVTILRREQVVAAIREAGYEA